MAVGKAGRGRGARGGDRGPVRGGSRGAPGVRGGVRDRGLRQRRGQGRWLREGGLGEPRVLEDLGFETPAEIDELAGDTFYAEFSAENVERLDADLLVWIAATDDVIAQIRASPLRQTLRATQEGREVFMDAEIGGAAGFSSPLSLPFLLEDLVPRFAAAVDGDPATPTA